MESLFKITCHEVIINVEGFGNLVKPIVGKYLRDVTITINEEGIINTTPTYDLEMSEREYNSILKGEIKIVEYKKNPLYLIKYDENNIIYIDFYDERKLFEHNLKMISNE